LDEIRQQYRTKLQQGEVSKETDTYGCNEAFVTATGEVTTVALAARDIVAIDHTNSSDTSPSPALADSDCGVKKRRRRRRGGNNTGGGGGGKKRTHVKAMGIKAAVTNEKRRPLLKGAKMIDKRTVQGKRAAAEAASLSARELAARAALARFGQSSSSTITTTSTVASAVGKEGGNGESATSNTSVTVSKTYDDGNCNSESKDEDSSSTNDDDSGDEEEEDDEIIHPHVQGCVCRSCDWDRILFLPVTKG
jgi:hypothetical protein